MSLSSQGQLEPSVTCPGYLPCLVTICWQLAPQQWGVGFTLDFEGQLLKNSCPSVSLCSQGQLDPFGTCPGLSGDNLLAAGPTECFTPDFEGQLLKNASKHRRADTWHELLLVQKPIKVTFRPQ